jgi:NADPH-dependent curcumin reductase CurA
MPMPATSSREIRLASRPTGWPTPDNFSLARVDVPAPADGQVLVKNLYISVDPYMRARMNDVKSYVPPFQIGQPLDGGAVGEVIESKAPNLKVGDIVSSGLGWREYFVADAKAVRAIPDPVQPVSAYLGVLGMTGMTAWVGLELAEVKAGDVVFVSAAAGAVGSVAGQIAKLRGCKVIGSAGSAEKVKVLTEELGFDAAFNYKDGAISKQLAAAAPDGIDVYFENVGGEHLEAALTALRPKGRIAACGMISKYNDEAPSPGPSNLALIVGKRLTIKGFIVSDWGQRTPDFLKEVGGYLAQGKKLKTKETVVEGIERAPEAFLDMLRGENVGKMVVKLA